MTRKAMNIIIGILFAFIILFYAGSFAYEKYIMDKSDSEYENTLEEDLDNTSKDNQSGQTNEESQYN